MKGLCNHTAVRWVVTLFILKIGISVNTSYLKQQTRFQLISLGIQMRVIETNAIIFCNEPWFERKRQA